MLHELTDRPTGQPTGTAGIRPRLVRMQMENQGNAVGVGPATGGGVVRCAPIEQSFYLTEDNSTNWFLLAGDVASFRAMQCSEATRERENAG